MELRRATPFDVSKVFNLLKQMHSETEIRVSPINTKKLLDTINSAIHDGVVLLAEIKGKVVGSIGGMLGSDWWSSEEYLGDYWFYVRPESRNSKIAIKLVKAFIKIGNEASVIVKLGHVYSGDIERKDSFFKRLGLVKAGSLYTEVK
jgi:GNAT superfamily N-acetyltransferase|tara:strand:- start:27 stop:467 length:441 start_codon:yes stop_codon:yes gene_type:complete